MVKDRGQRQRTVGYYAGFQEMTERFSLMGEDPPTISESLVKKMMKGGSLKLVERKNVVKARNELQRDYTKMLPWWQVTKIGAAKRKRDADLVVKRKTLAAKKGGEGGEEEEDEGEEEAGEDEGKAPSEASLEMSIDKAEEHDVKNVDEIRKDGVTVREEEIDELEDELDEDEAMDVEDKENIVAWRPGRKRSMDFSVDDSDEEQGGAPVVRRRRVVVSDDEDE